MAGEWSLPSPFLYQISIEKIPLQHKSNRDSAKSDARAVERKKLPLTCGRSSRSSPIEGFRFCLRLRIIDSSLGGFQARAHAVNLAGAAFHGGFFPDDLGQLMLYETI